jgi:hypothetical protein
MQLEKCPDFDKILARYEAWWHGEIIDRPPVWISCLPERAAMLPRRSAKGGLRDRWFDMDYAMDCLEARLDVAAFAGDAFPHYYPDLGPELCGAVFGCEIEFGENTSWSIPAAKSIRDILKIKPNLDNVYWQAIRRAALASLERGRGRWITGLPDFHTNGDLLASLRDPEQLCYDCADDIEGVRLACEHVTDSFALMYDDLYAPIAASGQPATTWCPAPHMGRAYVTSCDFICMISPAMFQAAILPALVREMRWLDCNMFHLDGPGALRHLDALLALPELNGVQWVSGAGGGSASDWIPVYQRIQAAGKCIQLMAEIDDAKKVLEHLRPEGVWITTGGCSRSDADAFLTWVETWAASKAHKPRR